MTAGGLEAEVAALLGLPRGRQPGALERILAALPPVAEAWNTQFGDGSLFEAWTRTTVAQGVYAAQVEILRPLLDARTAAGSPWRVIDVGVGNGRLWELLLRSEDRGELVWIDPMPEAHEAARARLPDGIRVQSQVGPVERAVLPDADVVVCSLTLHHVAGIDAAQRASHGLEGPGKLELLRAFRAAVARRAGRVLLVEADVHCEIDLAPGDPVLRERLLDSYVRRCGLSLVHDLGRAGVPDTLRRRWRAILQHWCLAQVGAWSVPVAARDVYELDVGRWRDLAVRAGFTVERVRHTDEYGLFCQYVLA